MNNNKIFLIGMMYSGKTTIGKLLSQKLNFPLFDLDNEIEKIMGISINEIFKSYGEDRFRLIETAFFKECSKLNNHIFAMGGGAIVNINNHSILKDKGTTFFLDSSSEIIFERFKQDKNKNNRPLLDNCSIELIDSLYHKRRARYKSCSKFIIDTDLLTEGQAVNQIEEYLNA